jgi:hypothetical protein
MGAGVIEFTFDPSAGDVNQTTIDLGYNSNGDTGGLAVADGAGATEITAGGDQIGFATFDFMGDGSLVLTEGTADGASGALINAGASTDEIGEQLEIFLNGNLVAANAAYISSGATTGIIESVSYDDATNTMLFTFESGVDADGIIDLGFLANGDTGAFAIGAAVVEDGAAQVDSVDLFGYLDGSDSVEGGMDIISNFNSGGVDDLIVFAEVANTGDEDANPLELFASVEDFSNSGTTYASFAEAAAAADVFFAAGGDDTELDIFVGSDGSDTWVFADTHKDGDYVAGEDFVVMLDGYDAVANPLVAANNFDF